MHNELSVALRSTRLAKGETQAQLAKRIGIVPKLLSRWECQWTAPRHDLLIAWANALGFNVTLTPRS